VPDGADEAVRATLDALQRPSQQPVALAGPVGVGRQDRRDPASGAEKGRQTVLFDRLAEVHEAPSAPRSEGGVTGRPHRSRV
jgi:hypothetical protein